MADSMPLTLSNDYPVVRYFCPRCDAPVEQVTVLPTGSFGAGTSGYGWHCDGCGWDSGLCGVTYINTGAAAAAPITINPLPVEPWFTPSPLHIKAGLASG